MSVRTEADEKLDSAKRHIRDAISDLNAIVVENCWGYDDYNDQYAEAINSAFKMLVDIKRMLRG